MSALSNSNITSEILLKRTNPMWRKLLYSDDPSLGTKKLLDTVIDKLLKLDPTFNSFTPNISDIFNFAKYSLSKTKVIILGQDPYYQKGSAHGYSFSTLDSKCPGSLKNIFKSLHNAGMLDTERPILNALTNWARQGVVLLNTSLTTKIGTANTHSKIWEPYTNRVIELLASTSTMPRPVDPINIHKPIVWFLWGKFAQSKEELISKGNQQALDRAQQSNIILKCCHPSPNCTTPKFVDDSQAGWNHIKNVCPEIWWNTLGHVGYTDGSCKNNQVPTKARASYGFHFNHGPFKGFKKGGAVLRKQIQYTDDRDQEDPDKLSTFHPSNIRGEGYAILNMLKHVLNNKSHMSVIIFTDSKFWIDMITKWMPNWAKKIDQKKMRWCDKKNFDLVEDMWNTVQKFKELKLPINLKYVPAHHDCKKEFIQDKTHSNYVNWAGNKLAEEIAEENLPPK